MRLLIDSRQQIQSNGMFSYQSYLEIDKEIGKIRNVRYVPLDDGFHWPALPLYLIKLNRFKIVDYRFHFSEQDEIGGH